MFLTKKAVSLILLLAVLSSVATLGSAVSIGVKKGDWIEYTVSSTGTLDESHNITAAKMEVMNVQGDVIQVNIVSTYSNGTQVSTISTLNLATGDLIDNFIIPANLTTGQEFNTNMGNMGKMMIGDSRQGTYCGATRSVVTTKFGGNTYTWDQATGVSVEGYSEGTLDGRPYTMRSLAASTNMWQAEASVTPDMTFVYAVAVGAAIIVLAAVAVLIYRRPKK